MFLKEKVSNIILKERPSTIVNEAYRIARTNLMAMISNKSYKSILVTSPSSLEGKTTVCKNMAIAFAQANKKVLIIDSNMRNPEIHNLFLLPSNPGLSDILGEFSDVVSCINETDITNLSILPAGTIVSNPSELIALPIFKETIKFLSERYDYIFIDTPAVNLFSDTISILNNVDAVVLVAKYAKTSKKMIMQAIDMFNMVNANVLGILLNSYDMTSYFEHMGIRGKKDISHQIQLTNGVLKN